MRNGLTVQELATEIRRQRDNMADYTGTTNRMTMTSDHEAGAVRFDLDGVGAFEMLKNAHRQVGIHTGVPARYYDRMLINAPELLAENVNHWLRQQPSQRMVRTLDGRMRAFLSDRYRPMDHADLAEAVLPAITKAGATVHSAQITETKLYIKAVVDGQAVEIPKPAHASGPGYSRDVVLQPGIVISNSEVGAGAVTVQPAIHELACLNMATWAADALRKAHLGRRIATDNENIDRYISERSMKLADEALWSQVRDIAEAAMSGDMFEDLVSRMTVARSNTFSGAQASGVIERISLSKGLTNDERDSVLAHLIEGGELSQYGVQAAVTRASQDVEDYDRASEMEVMGGDIIAYSGRDWAKCWRGSQTARTALWVRSGAARTNPATDGGTESMREANKAETAIADWIIDLLDQGELPPWERPWRYSLGGAPHNAVSNREYRGINRWVCGLTQELMGWAEPRWMTEKQVREHGGEINEGEKPTQIIFWKVIKPKKKDDDGENKKTGRSYPMARLYRVYNVAQTIGCQLPTIETEKEHEPNDPIEEAERIIREMPNPPEITFYAEGNMPPHYMPALDRVSVPERDRFHTAELFYNTMFHELTHATGHPSRLARLKPHERPDRHEYGAEELVAGMGAAMLADCAGLSHATVETDASYIQHWRDVISADKRIVVMAGQRAQKAFDLITNRAAANEAE